MTTRPKKKTTTAKKLCSKVIKREGVKSDGTLKKGYKYVKGGRVVKVVAKKAAPKKKATGLGKTGRAICRRQNPDGSHTSYNAFGGDRPCPYGGSVTTLAQAALNGAKKKPAAKKKPVKKTAKKVVKKK